MPSVTLTKIIQPGGGKVVFQFGKFGLVFGSIGEAVAYAQAQLTPEALRSLAIALCLTRQPALGNPAALEGHTVAVDFTLANWGTIT